MDSTFLGGFIEYVLPWLFGFICIALAALDCFGVFYRQRAKLVGILSLFLHVLLILSSFLLGFEMHLMVLILFSSILLILILEYARYLFLSCRAVKEEENDL